MTSSTDKQRLLFKEEYTRLNEQQRLAVDTIEGPVMVKAGPGTGKTQILALRIGNIVQQTDTDPNNILCLTFTDNGAAEMRNRLLKIMGSAAYKVQIHTFHSFCNEVIQDNISFFGKQNLSAIDDLEEIDLFYKLIDRIPADNVLKRFRGDAYYDKDRLKSLFSLMKKQYWTPDYLTGRINAYIKSLPYKEGFYYKRAYKNKKAGEPKPEAIKQEELKMEELKAGADLYPQYNEMMLEAGRYNFDDMILWVLKAFETNNNLLLDYQERYLYFLVDEFQDTSRSQNLLLQYLAGYWEVPNLFVVGDADQSIFSFQDANVKNIRAFERKYEKTLVKIKLTHNYRSTAPVLNAAFALIKQNIGRDAETGVDKPLISANPLLRDIATIPEIVEYNNPAQEAIDITIKIERLLNQGIKGNEIAVIYRNHIQVEPIIAMLEARQIPVNAKKKVDLLQLPFIQNIILILTWISRERDKPYTGDDLLFSLLHCEFFKLNSLEIAKLTIAANKRESTDQTKVNSLRKVIAESPLPQADLFHQPDGYSIKNVSDTLEGLLKFAANATVQQLLEQLIQKAGVLSFVMRSPEKPWWLQALNSLFNSLKDHCHRNPDLTLEGWLNILERMKTNRLSLPLYKVTANENGVNLVTAHGAKGSEFAHVFVMGCTQNIWDNNSRSGNRSFKLPDNLMGGNDDTAEEDSHVDQNTEESRRLFYVAITRAKTDLQISYSLKDDKEKDLTRSAFVSELIENGALPLVAAQVDENLLSDYLLLQFKEKASPEIELVEKEYINQLLKTYTLSVTHLNNFLSCPLKFYYQNLLRVPAAKNENMTFGSAIHNALDQLFKKMKDNNHIFPPRDTFVYDFMRFMRDNREAFTPEGFKRRMEYGEKILPAYYDFYVNKWNKIVASERNIRNVTVQHVPINGKLDKLEFSGNLVNIVDYKTGKYQNARKKLTAPNEKEPNGGDYWRQAVFYKILLDNYKEKEWNAVSTEFDFVEPVGDEYKTEKIDVTPADITTVTQQIISTWEKIGQHEFRIGCGKPDCEWCNFVKTNHLAVALHEAGEEEL